MSGFTADAAAPAARRARVATNIVLAVLVTIVLACLLAVLIGGVQVIPGKSRAEKAGVRYDAVADAAARGAVDFLTIDYKDMDTWQAKVLAQSTGSFKQQYSAVRASVKTSARAAKAEVTPKIREVAVSQVSTNKATVYIAANLIRKTIRTKNVKATTKCPYKGAQCLGLRVKVSLSRTSAGWKLSDVQAGS